MIDPKGDWAAASSNHSSEQKDDLHRLALTGWELGECAAQRGDVLTQPLQLFWNPRFLLKGSRWRHTTDMGDFKGPENQNWTSAKVTTVLVISQRFLFSFLFLSSLSSVQVELGGAQLRKCDVTYLPRRFSSIWSNHNHSPAELAEIISFKSHR